MRLFKLFLYLVVFCAATACFAQSPNGTTIPPATQIVDSHGGVWTVNAGGLCYLNGVPAGNCNSVQTLLLYAGSIYGSIYVGSTFGTWWLWNGSGWGQVAADPRAASPSAPSPSAPSASGTTVPSAATIVDSNGGVWTVNAGGICYLNGVPAGNCNSVQTLLFDNGSIYVGSTFGTWWLWNGTGWGQVAGDPRAPSPSGTTMPPSAQIVDLQHGVWTVDGGGICYLNGVQAGGCFAVQTLLFYQGQIYVDSAYGTWWLWNGSSWTAVSKPVIVSPSGTTIPSATQIVDTNGGVWRVNGAGI